MNAILKYVIIIAVVVVGMLVAAYFLFRAYSKSLTFREVRVGHLPNFPPFWYPHQGDKPWTGIDADVSKAVLQRVGVKKIKYVERESFQKLYDALHNHEIDMIANNLWATPGRMKDFHFSVPYFYRGGIGMIFLKTRGKEFRSGKDLEGKIIGVMTGDDSENYLPPYHYKEVRSYRTASEILDAVLDGQIDAGAEEYGLFVTLEHPGKSKVADLLIEPLASTLGTNKNDYVLNEKINQALEDMWNDSSLYWIKSKYLPENLIEPFNYSPYR